MTNSIFAKSLCAAAAIAVTTFGFSAGASAQQRSERSVQVSYSDLDLTSADGKAALAGRLKGAVRKVCGGYNSRDLTDTMDHLRCTQEAKLSAKRASVTILAAAAAGEPIETAMVISRD